MLCCCMFRESHELRKLGVEMAMLGMLCLVVLTGWHRPMLAPASTYAAGVAGFAAICHGDGRVVSDPRQEPNIPAEQAIDCAICLGLSGAGHATLPDADGTAISHGAQGPQSRIVHAPGAPRASARLRPEVRGPPEAA